MLKISDDKIREILEAWGAWCAGAIPALGAKRRSVEGKMMLYGVSIDQGQVDHVPGYYPPRYKAILAANAVIRDLPSRHKAALEIRYVSNLDEEKESARTGLTKKAIEERNRRARAAFKAAYVRAPHWQADREKNDRRQLTAEG